MKSNKHLRRIMFITLLSGILVFGWIAWTLARQNGPAAPAQAVLLPTTNPLPVERLTPNINLTLDIEHACAPRVASNPLLATECVHAFETGDATNRYNNNLTIPTALSNIVRPTSSPYVFLQRPAGAGRIIQQGLFTNYFTHVVTESAWIEKITGSFQVAVAANDFGNFSHDITILEFSLEGDNHILHGGGYYPLPIQGQDFDIIDAVGETLLLRTIGGSTFAFDTVARQYISPVPYQPIQRSVSGGTLIEDGAVPFTRPGYTGWNRWSTRQPDGQTLTVYAGADQADGKIFSNGKPLLAVMTSQGEPGPGDPIQFYQPTFENGSNQGLLQIFEVKGSQVLLQTHSEGEIAFDLSTRSFLPRTEVGFHRNYPNFEYGGVFDGPFPNPETATPVTPSPALPTLNASDTPFPSSTRTATPETPSASLSDTPFPSSTRTATPETPSASLSDTPFPSSTMTVSPETLIASPSSLPSAAATDTPEPANPTPSVTPNS